MSIIHLATGCPFASPVSVTFQLRVTPKLPIPVLGLGTAFAMDIPTAHPCWDVELQPSTGRGERAGCSSSVCVPLSPSLQLLSRVGDWGLEHILGTLRVPKSQGVLWNWTGMGMERSLPLIPSLSPPGAFLKVW